MRDTGKRLIGYGVSCTVLAGLVYGGFIRTADPDVGTLLGAAEVQLRLAMSYPAHDKNGAPMAAREGLLVEIERLVDAVDEIEPGLFETLELRAYLAYAHGDNDRSIALYRQLEAHPGCREAYRTNLAFNRAGLLEEAGRPEEALASLQRSQGRMAADDRVRSQLRQARILDRLGRRPEARDLLVGITRAEATTPMRLLVAAHTLEELGALEEADAAYLRASADEPLANYYLARLKVRSGQIDKGLTLLERAVEAAGPKVRDFVRDDEADWAPCAEIERFKNVMNAAAAAAPPGR